MKHTPGPWRLCVGTGATEIRGEPAGGLSNPRVCRVLRADPNEAANARLIAAAPELLAALRDMVSGPECRQDALFVTSPRFAWDQARAAIAKATEAA